jgi:hypothetical protein
VFAGNTTEGVAHAFYDWLSPRLWPLIVGSDQRSTPIGGTGVRLTGG